MIVLGFHGATKLAHDDEPSGFAWHDGAAVLVRDGEVLAAIEEERLDRMKHSNAFPARAVARCLAQCGVGFEQVDRLATNRLERGVHAAATLRFLEDPRVPRRPSARDYLADAFRRALDVDVRDKLWFCHHHVAHAWSAYVPSGFDRSLVFVVDGDGDGSSGMIFKGEGASLERLHTFGMAQSLGNLYQRVIALVGYRRFDEYKVMGLAPYGDPDRYAALFESCYALLPNGDYRLESWDAWMAAFESDGLIDAARRRSDPFSQTHKDLAAGLQRALETIVLHVLRHYRDRTGLPCVCLAGGVAHNCTLNGRIHREGVFDRVYVQPAAHDAGGALGAAWAASYAVGPPARRPRLPHLYLGSDIGTADTIEAGVFEWSDLVDIERPAHLTTQIAQSLADGAVAGWVQGRAEFGPRALGHRSILADPRPAGNKERINAMVKKREAYRPFAPSVLEERAAEYFELPPGHTSFPFMVVVVPVRPGARRLLGAITHVDGTARVHTVSRESSPEFWALIHAFGELTGVPMVLNTSFNNHAEPIVDSVEDAVACFLTTGLDVLAVGPFLIRKRAQWLSADAWTRLVPQLPAAIKLVSRIVPSPDGGSRRAPALERTRSDYFGPATQAISEEMFALLALADGRQPFGTLAASARTDGASWPTPSLLDETLALWSARFIALRPCTAAAPASIDTAPALAVAAFERKHAHD